MLRKVCPQLEAEKFVTCTSLLVSATLTPDYDVIMFWEKDQLLPYRRSILLRTCSLISTFSGMVFLLERSIVFMHPPNTNNPTTKIIIPFKDVQSITKEMTLSVVGNSIKISLSTQISPLHFHSRHLSKAILLNTGSPSFKETHCSIFWVLFLSVIVSFHGLERLWQDNFKTWQFRLDPEGLGTKPLLLSLSSWRSGKQARQHQISTNMAAHDQMLRENHFKTIFKVPETASEQVRSISSHFH